MYVPDRPSINIIILR